MLGKPGGGSDLKENEFGREGGWSAGDMNNDFYSIIEYTYFYVEVYVMKQYEAVIHALENLGGQATLGQLYIETMKIPNCEWKTKTPFASIRRIVQDRPEIFKVRPGLWALRSYKTKLGLTEYSRMSPLDIEQGHSYYQGLIVEIGNLRKYFTFIPNQDKRKHFIGKELEEIRTLQSIPNFGYDNFVNCASTIDVSWFNDRKMPLCFFEVEHFD